MSKTRLISKKVDISLHPNDPKNRDLYQADSEHESEIMQAVGDLYANKKCLE